MSLVKKKDKIGAMDVRLEHDLFFNQTTAMRLANDLPGNVPMEIGVRQGDIFSSDFFSL